MYTHLIGWGGGWEAGRRAQDMADEIDMRRRRQGDPGHRPPDHRPDLLTRAFSSLVKLLFRLTMVWPARGIRALFRAVRNWQVR